LYQQKSFDASLKKNKNNNNDSNNLDTKNKENKNNAKGTEKVDDNNDSNKDNINVVNTNNNADNDDVCCATIQMSGTSMATPVAAGVALLLRQYFMDDSFWNRFCNKKYRFCSGGSFVPSGFFLFLFIFFVF
jgi:hypothetical protein